MIFLKEADPDISSSHREFVKPAWAKNPYIEFLRCFTDLEHPMTVDDAVGFALDQFGLRRYLINERLKPQAYEIDHIRVTPDERIGPAHEQHLERLPEIFVYYTYVAHVF